MTTDIAPAHGLTLTDAAVDKVRRLLEMENSSTPLRLRLAVQPGGCSGLRYQMYFDDKTLDNDLIVDFEGVEVVVDKKSSLYLSGASITFEDTISQQGFVIDNPNAEGTCACGDSFH